jgi:hypothetical protein
MKFSRTGPGEERGNHSLIKETVVFFPFFYNLLKQPATSKMKFNFILLLLAIAACSKNSIDTSDPDPPGNNPTVNLPPGSFSVQVDSISDKRAVLFWPGAVDPEGDSVWYDIYLNDKLIAASLTSNLPFAFTGLSELTGYRGKVVAKDRKDKKTEAPFSFTTEKYYLNFLKSYEYGPHTTEWQEGDVKQMIKLLDGSYIIVGGYYTHVPNRNDTHIIAVKTDYDGNIVWKKTYPYGTGPGADVAVTECADGILIASLYSLFKIDKDGNMIWYKKIESFNDNDGGTEIRSVKVDNEDNILIAGGRTDPHPDRLQEGVVVKLDRFGNTIWEKAINSVLYSFFYDMLVTPSNEVVVLGHTEGNGITYEEYLSHSADYQSDFWLVKLSSDGGEIWQKKYGDNKQDIPGKLILKSNGHYVFAGSTWGVATDLQGRIFEIDEEGSELSSLSYGNMLFMLSITETLDGGLATCGFSELSYGRQLEFRKFDNVGNLIWEQSRQEMGTFLFGRSILAEQDGGYRLLVSEAKYAAWTAPPHFQIYKTNPMGRYNY